MSIQWELSPQHSGSLICLQTLLDKLQGFNALIVQHNNPPYRDGLIHFIQQSQTLILDLKKLGGFSQFEQAYNVLEEATTSVHIINLESLNRQKQQAFFRGINYHREHLARTLQGSLIFWLNSPLIKKMALEAADFWAWREQVIDFALQEESSERHQERWSKIVNLDSPEKRQRIAEINEFLQQAFGSENLTQADLHQELGRLYWSIGDYAKAEDVIQIAITAYTTLDEAQSKAISQRDLAEIWDTQGKKDKALTLLKNKILPIFTQLKNKAEIAETYGAIAEILQSRGDLDEALRIRETEQLPVYEKLGDMRGLLIARVKLAMTFWEKDQKKYSDKAQKLLCLALQDAKQMKIPEAEQVEGILQQIGLSCEYVF